MSPRRWRLSSDGSYGRGSASSVLPVSVSAWNDFGKFSQDSTIVTGGAGFRYELARKYGLHMGIDLAFGPDEPIIYVQFGSAWLRP